MLYTTISIINLKLFNMKTLFTTILIICAQILFAQTVSVDSLFEQFVKDIETVQAYHDGVLVWDDETRESYYLLMINSPVEALIPYTDHANAAVRCLIFSGLVNNNADDKTLKEILEKHQNDTAEYISRSTDIQITWNVGEYMKLTLEHRTSDRIDYEKRLSDLRQEPHVLLPGLRHGRISRDNLLRADSLKYSHVFINVQSFIMSFKVGDRIIDRQSDSHLFTPAMKRRIKKLQPDDRVFFSDIMVQGPNGRIKQIGSLTVVIK